MIRQTGLLYLSLHILCAAPPTLVELRPRGAEIGRPFTLTIIGRDIPEGSRIWSTMPASFTPVVASDKVEAMMPQQRSAQFLVEPKASLTPGTYPIRIETPSGISNVLLFSIGTFPELTEQESLQYAEPHRNDTIENAEPIQSTPILINGTLRGAERDVYRIYAKAGETRVLEVEARRAGSAVDPVLRILDPSGKQLVRTDDSAGLDPRIQFTFPREGHYYVELHDARFSTQMQNFYRLKMGAYAFADQIFPLGGRRGAATAVTYSGGSLQKPLKGTIDLTSTAENHHFAYASMPGSASLPFLFAVSDYPELIEPTLAVPVPSVINGRISEAGKSNRYQIKVEPGDKLLLEVQARELGTSKLEAILTAYTQDGKKIDSAGDKPLPEDVFAVQGTSRTSSDPFLNLTVPPGEKLITLAIEDLALRGGPDYGFRIVVRRQPEDFRLTLSSPLVNIPAGGTTFVVAIADRRGYNGPIELSIPELPKGIRAEGGMIPREYVDANNARTFNRRGVLILSSESGVELPATQLVVWGEGKLDDGSVLRRRASGPAMAVEVAGATVQGVVDRQRALTAPWLGLDLPAAITTPQSAALEVRQVNFTRMEEGDRYDFAYTWKLRSPGARLPRELSVDVIGARDIRVTSFEKTEDGGTFSINTTKATDPARYDIIVRGRLGLDSGNEEVYARPVPLIVTERSSNVQVTSAQ